MTLPDKLIQAAAEAITEASKRAHTIKRPIAEQQARAALTVAFAALPECEEAQLIGGRGLIKHYANNPHQTFHHEPSVAAVVIDAIAQEFGDKS